MFGRARHGGLLSAGIWEGTPPRGGGAAQRSVGGAAAGPDQAVAVLGVDQGRVDRGREAGVVELDGEVVAVLSGGLLPGRAELGLAGEDAEVGRLVVVLVGGPELGGLDVEAEGLDRAAVGAVGLLVEGADGGHGKSPVVLRPRPSRPRWRSGAEGRPPSQPQARSVSGGRRTATCLL